MKNRFSSPFLLTALLGNLCLAACGSASAGANDRDGIQLLERARATRQEAESDLAKTRLRHTEERKELARQLQQAYERLEAARRREHDNRARLEAVTKELSNLQQSRPLGEAGMESLIRQAVFVLNVQADGSRSEKEIEDTLAAALSRRFEGLAKAVRMSSSTERIVDRNGAHAEVPVLRLGAFVAYACGRTPASCGLLQPVADGPPLVVGPELNAESTALLQSAAQGTVTRLPIDVDGSLPERGPKAGQTLQSWMAAGGMFMYPIVMVALMGMVLTLERLVYLTLTRKPPDLLEKVLESIRRDSLEEARARTQTARGPTARVIRAAVKAHGSSLAERETAMESALLAEAPRIERSLTLIGALASVAPLLGLLGTVSGMIATFNTISAVGTGNPRLLSGGISEALITTQFGLMVGIPLLLVHAWLSRWAERREAMLEYDAIQAFGLQKQEPKK